MTTDVQKVLTEFERELPAARGKARLTSGSRSWEEQLDIILDPKRASNYPNIKMRFKARFKLQHLPTSRAELSQEQRAWWKREILLQAGKSPGFPHVGGRAQDISVNNLTVDQRRKLKEKLEASGYGVLMETVTGTTSKYGVPLPAANVFHVHR